jgi:ligand-binding sensor domain-containing protein
LLAAEGKTGEMYCATGWGERSKEVAVVPGRGLMDPLSLTENDLPLGPEGKGCITALFVDSSGALWVGTSHGVARVQEGTVSLKLVFAPADSPAPPDARITSEYGVHVTSIAQSPDGVIWFATLRGIASWDGKDLRWYATDETPHPVHDAKAGATAR